MLAADQVLIITTPDSPSIADALKTKIIAEKVGAKPIGIIINFVRNEAGEISKEKIMTLMELPSYGSIPFDIEVRKTFLEKNVMPVIIRKPKSPASIAFKNIALKLCGKQEETIEKKESFITRLLNKLFKKKQQA
jgi:septum site-determining protein MinD